MLAQACIHALHVHCLHGPVWLAVPAECWVHSLTLTLASFLCNGVSCIGVYMHMSSLLLLLGPIVARGSAVVVPPGHAALLMITTALHI
jgi:hypothetical protein